MNDDGREECVDTEYGAQKGGCAGQWGPGGRLGCVQRLRLGFWWLSLALGALGALLGQGRMVALQECGRTRKWESWIRG